ncbi:FIGNL1-interacting regulator of recombination and mitosis isoform X3 [Neoarius graeffei]|uniref:FIGNL1-interacting regulator of recombination and mitosis isoform X3 n=1 Tax=Neoarius graeffei TaxID=443677 RepID=UPI00298C38BC|nr:FIGNL1-interacting regulator of recombination and mitosis isoform X3 [Neoarius graeffei]
MSQATLLEEVVQWSPETCQQQLKAVLPKLVSIHHNTNSWNEHISVLQIIVNMFLPHLPPSELEEECFSKILPKVVVMFTGLLEEIAKHIGDLSSQNTELHTFLRNILQMMVQTLETLSACVRHVCALDEATSLESIRSLPSCILHILKDTFQHCKDSEIVYSGRLSLVGDLLQGLFREAYSLQKCLMELLDKISLENSASEEEISDIVTVIHSLLDICSVISNLDIALHANTWKFIIKQSVKYQSLVEEHLRHSDLVTFLCEDLLASLQNSLEMAEQMQQSDLKIKSCSSASYQLTHLGLLLRRLLFLMTPNHQLEFVECFLPSKDENFCLWSPVLLSSLCSDVRARVEVEVLSGVQAALDTWHGAGYRLGNIHTLNKALSCLLVVVRAEPLQTECMTSSLTIIHQLWNRMDAAQVQIHPSLQCTLRLLLSISGKLIKSIEPQAIVQGFSCLIGLNLQKCQDDLVLAILEYLASMGKVFVPADIQFQVLPRLSCLFSTLLIHESWLLHQHTLEAFATFAEATNHEEFISQSLTTEETKNKVVNFLSKIITDQQAAGVHMEQLRAEAVVIERHNNRLERREKTSAQTSVAEPCAKRPRQETCKQEEYERYLQAAESALRALQGIGGTASSLPQWVTSRLQALQALITQINSNSPHPL